MGRDDNNVSDSGGGYADQTQNSKSLAYKNLALWGAINHALMNVGHTPGDASATLLAQNAAGAMQNSNKAQQLSKVAQGQNVANSLIDTGNFKKKSDITFNQNLALDAYKTGAMKNPYGNPALNAQIAQAKGNQVLSNLNTGINTNTNLGQLQQMMMQAYGNKARQENLTNNLLNNLVSGRLAQINAIPKQYTGAFGGAAQGPAMSSPFGSPTLLSSISPVDLSTYGYPPSAVGTRLADNNPQVQNGFQMGYPITGSSATNSMGGLDPTTAAFSVLINNLLPNANVGTALDQTNPAKTAYSYYNQGKNADDNGNSGITTHLPPNYSQMSPADQLLVRSHEAGAANMLMNNNVPQNYNDREQAADFNGINLMVKAGIPEDKIMGAINALDPYDPNPGSGQRVSAAKSYYKKLKSQT